MPRRELVCIKMEENRIIFINLERHPKNIKAFLQFLLILIFYLKRTIVSKLKIYNYWCIMKI